MIIQIRFAGFKNPADDPVRRDAHAGRIGAIVVGKRNFKILAVGIVQDNCRCIRLGESDQFIQDGRQQFVARHRKARSGGQPGDCIHISLALLAADELPHEHGE